MFDALDTPGGHIAVCFVLLCLAAVFFVLGLRSEGHDLIIFASGVLSRSMMGKT